MQTFGDFLKEQREFKNISLKDIAHSTNVTERYLDFIEKNEFEKVPEGPYIRGYISLYASAVGINANEALARFDSQCGKRNTVEDIQQEIPKYKIQRKSLVSSSNKGKWFVLCSAVLGLLILVVYQFSSEDGSQSLVLANVQAPEKKELPTDHTIKPKENILPFTTEIPEPEKTVMEGTSGERKAEEIPGYETSMKVLEYAICADVKDRKPFGENDSFKWYTDKVYIWNSIKSDSRLSSIRHTYYFAGKKISDIVLDVRSPIWRTWSCKSIANKSLIGPWRVDITSEDGELLKSVYFEIS